MRRLLQTRAVSRVRACSSLQVFDKGLKVQQRERPAWLARATDPRHEEVPERLLERPRALKRPLAPVRGAGQGGGGSRAGGEDWWRSGGRGGPRGTVF